MLAPLWVGPALLVGLARICGDGLRYLLEAWTGRSPRLPWVADRLLDFAAIAVFPLLIALETAASFVVGVGGLPARLLTGSDEGVPVALRAATGVVLLPLAPLWFPLLALGWMSYSLLWRLLIVPGSDRFAGWVRGERRGKPPAGRFSTFVALRYMRGRKASAGVNVVTSLTILGVMLGVWTLVTVLSVMAGFEKDLQDKILGANSHVVVLSYTGEVPDWPTLAERSAQVPGVEGVTPFIYSEFMIRSRHTAMGAIFKGIDPATVGDVTDLLDNIVQGPGGRIDDPAEAQVLLSDLDRKPEGEAAPMSGLVIGQEMATTLRVTVGDTVHAYSPAIEPGPLGSFQASVTPFRVAGIFHSGMYEYDTKFCYANLAAGQKLMKLAADTVTGLEVSVDDLYAAPRIASQIGARLQYPYWTRDWQKMNEPLFAALKLEKVVMGLILSFIVAVASMNIISTLIMLVLEKRREIAILKAMGAGRLDLMRLFLVDGLLVGFIGTVLGLIFGLASCFALDRWQFIKLESDVYYVDTLPVVIDGWLIAVVAVVAVLIAFLATLFPSWEGSTVDPVEGLRDA